MKGKWGKPGRPPKWFLEEQTQAAELVHEVDEIDDVDEDASVGHLSAFEIELIKMRHEAKEKFMEAKTAHEMADKEFLEAKKAQNKMQKMYKDAMSKPKGAKPKPKLKGSSDEKPKKEKVTWTQPGMRGRPPN